MDLTIRNIGLEDLIYELNEKMDHNDFSNYWPGFEKLAFALFDSEKVYLSGNQNNIRASKSKHNLSIINWSEEFSANTTILYNDDYIGIWCIDEITREFSVNRLYASILHEMFHGYQQKNGEIRWANEMLLAQYSFNSEIIELRMQERLQLLKAVYEVEQEKKLEHINRFMDYRESRAAITGNDIHYEYGIESIEGTATYIEFKAYLAEMQQPELYLLAEYGKNLVGSNSIKNFRASCYYSGLFIALILDDILPDWKQAYNTNGKYLYEFLKNNIKHEPEKIIPQNSHRAQQVIEEYNTEKSEVYKKFHEYGEYKIIINGEIKLTGFDPMNITYYDTCKIHNRYICLNNKYHINKRVLTINGEVENEIKQAYIYTNEIPIVLDNQIIIDNELTLFGDVFVEGMQFTVKIK